MPMHPTSLYCHPAAASPTARHHELRNWAVDTSTSPRLVRFVHVRSASFSQPRSADPANPGLCRSVRSSESPARMTQWRMSAGFTCAGKTHGGPDEIYDMPQVPSMFLFLSRSSTKMSQAAASCATTTDRISCTLEFKIRGHRQAPCILPTGTAV